MTKEEQAEAWANENGDVTKHYDWDISKNGFLAGWEACERSKWIPVSERLPELNTEIMNTKKAYVIVSAPGYNDESSFEAMFDGQDFYDTEDDYFTCTEFVTHWQPLPIPPQKESA